ncbi:hypothetical protein EDC04DRAFT_2605973 [Pisolithus marmoratus]|nr:hypothetical protein EDC04DRAFT_2605973 [Pisolithus marmoratus]
MPDSPLCADCDMLTPEHVAANVSVLHHGKDPSSLINDVTFTQSNSLILSVTEPRGVYTCTVGRTADPSDFSPLMPAVFAEVWLRVYTKCCMAPLDEQHDDRETRFIVSPESQPIPTNAVSVDSSINFHLGHLFVAKNARWMPEPLQVCYRSLSKTQGCDGSRRDFEEFINMLRENSCQLDGLEERKFLMRLFRIAYRIVLLQALRGGCWRGRANCENLQGREYASSLGQFSKAPSLASVVPMTPSNTIKDIRRHTQTRRCITHMPLLSRHGAVD